MNSKTIIKPCPFCGKKPKYDNDSQLVHCETLDCAIHSWYIHIDEWNKRNSRRGRLAESKDL